MNRQEAQNLIDTRVSAWTAWRGVYAGKLKRIIPARPWRGVIEVEFVLHLPDGEKAHILRPGEELEVGGVNVTPYSGEPVPWEQSVKNQVACEKIALDNWEEQNKARGWSKASDDAAILFRRRALANFRRQLDAVSPQTAAPAVG